jgi:hypothetical protein
MDCLELDEIRCDKKKEVMIPRRMERGLRAVFNRHILGLLLKPSQSCTRVLRNFRHWLRWLFGEISQISCRNEWLNTKMKQHTNEMNENMTQVKHEFIKSR